MRKVCIVGPSKKFLSGISYHTIRLANALKDDFNVSVVCFRNLLPSSLFPGRQHIGKNISLLEYSKRIKVYDGMDYNSPVSWLKAGRFLDELSPDVIILQWWSSTVAHLHLILKMLNKRQVRARILLDIHEVIDPMEGQILPIRYYSRLVGNLLRRDLDGYIVHSNVDIDTLSKTYGIEKSKIHVIPMGLYDHYGPPIDIGEARVKLGINEKNVILNFGLIRKYKGVDLLINAFNDLPEKLAKNTRLLIVGEIWDKDLKIPELVKDSKYNSQITLVDRYISDEEVKVYFSSADALILPYLRSSGSGISLIGMAFAKPIIVSEIGALAENLAEYQGTYFVPPQDTGAITKAIQKVLGDRNKKIKTPDMHWDKIALEYQKVFEKLEK